MCGEGVAYQVNSELCIFRNNSASTSIAFHWDLLGTTVSTTKKGFRHVGPTPGTILMFVCCVQVVFLSVCLCYFGVTK